MARRLVELEVASITIDEAKERYILTKGVRYAYVLEVMMNAPRFILSYNQHGHERYAMIVSNLEGRYLLTAIALGLTTSGVWSPRTGSVAGAARDFTKVSDMSESDKDYIADLERQVENDDFEGWERVPGRVSKNLTVTYAIRLSPEEHKLFAEAAESRGMSLADLMRSATRAAIKGELDADARAALSKARDTAKELAEALNRF